MRIINIHGGSMYPTLATGDRAILSNRKIKCGDIITYRYDGYFITHRIISLHPRIRTKGDNIPFIDPFEVTHEKIIGVVNIVYKENTKEWYNLNSSYIRFKHLLYANLELNVSHFFNSLTKRTYNYQIKGFLGLIYYHFVTKRFNSIYSK